MHAALIGLGSLSALIDAGPEKASTAQIRKSTTPYALISFEDGKTYKTLRRHLTPHGLSPEAYRAKGGLPNDYPTASASDSAKRSELARSLGLGQRRRKTASTPEPKATPKSDDDTSADKPKRVGRPWKVKEPA